MAYWAEIKYRDSLGLDMGLTFSFANHGQFLKTISRFGLSKGNVTAYQVSEGTKTYSIPIEEFGKDVFSDLSRFSQTIPPSN